MAQSIDAFLPLIDGRNYPELPDGIQRWTYNPPKQTGGATSTITFQLDFNPNQNATFEKYVGISKIAIFTETAALTEVGVKLSSGSADFEDNAGNTNVPFGRFPMETLDTAVKFAGEWDRPHYFGRVNPGTSGRVSILVQEILNTEYNVYASGLISDRPFLMPWFWRP